MTSEKKDAWCLQIVWGESERRWKKHRRETTWNNYSSHLPSWKNSFPAAWPKRKLVNPTRIVCQIWGLTGWRPVNPFKYCRSAVICIYICIIYISLCVCGYGKAGPNVTYLGCLNLGRLRLSHYSANPVTSNDKQWQTPVGSCDSAAFNLISTLNLTPRSLTSKYFVFATWGSLSKKHPYNL